MTRYGHVFDAAWVRYPTWWQRFLAGWLGKTGTYLNERDRVAVVYSKFNGTTYVLSVETY